MDPTIFAIGLIPLTKVFSTDLPKIYLHYLSYCVCLRTIIVRQNLQILDLLTLYSPDL